MFNRPLHLAAVVPLNRQDQAKSRLSPQLSPPWRQKLFRAMSLDVLSVLNCHPAITDSWVISQDELNMALADRMGAQFLRQPDDERGLSRALQSAMHQLRHRQYDGLVVVHGDLPRISDHALSSFLEQILLQKGKGMVIATDKHGLGTNAVFCPLPSKFRFAYGSDSCHRHVAVAHALELECKVMNIDALAQDVDGIDDIIALFDCASYSLGRHTRALLPRLADEIRPGLTTHKTSRPQLCPLDTITC
ncbi:2-phospho-L-lactate guanylyltransferase [Pseudomaricurvus alkylphenolicus]|uniref:2-phospho-L-lactate guanylyltransferase n=1 Tax=Pseudomaricurvus alkylphenolicus TaxID=1306991 RepID=UPI001422060B|nr:2-phospho-L-lactate guanylyltransferase [Pseudomaricurvus alkylphenolicus]NIB42153.1 2-phospho-L-lactate guanylyltransferase [Pseudomaricurvus alkylphenolicus]